MENRPILVTGATGTVGREVVRRLVDAGHRVRALVRDPHKAEQFGGAVEVAVADLQEPRTLAPAFRGARAAFVLSTGPQLAVMEGNAFDAAQTAGVEHIVKLSGRHLDTDFMSDTPLAGWHTESEQRLRSLDLRWTILRPGAFASNFLMWLDREHSAVFLPVGDGADSFIDPRDIADVAVVLLTTPGHDGAIYEITGPDRLGVGPAVRKISEATGHTVQYRDIPVQTARQAMLSQGTPESMVDSMLSYFAGIKAGKVYSPTRTVAALLGRPPRSFDDWAHDNAAALRDAAAVG
jgi:uncharacterized protein YbjT (DUF2867 family)